MPNIFGTSEWGDCLSGPDKDVATLACVPVVLQNVINALVLLAGVVCVFLIIFAGIKFITSEGDPEKISSARRTMLYAIGGMLLVISSFFILNILSSSTGIERIAPIAP